MKNDIKLFTCGPVKMYPEVAMVRSEDYIHFRTVEYGNKVKKNLNKISNLLGNSFEDSLIYIASSGTGAMEATVENCLSTNDKVLVLNGGGFGKRFGDFCLYHKIPFDFIDLKWNESLTQEHLLPFENKGYTTLLVNIHETTSGQLYDKQLLSDFCSRNNMYFIVDAISSFLIDDYDMEKYGIDCTIFSSQKGLCCSPGCSFISFSPRMKERIMTSNTNVASKYFDFKDYIENISRGQTPYTPAVMIMYELEKMLNIIEKAGGKDLWLKQIEKKGQYFRKKVKSLNLTIPTYPISNMLTPIYFKENNAIEIINKLKNDYQIYVNPCGGPLADKLLRVSHIGNTNFDDIDMLIEKLKICLEKNRGSNYDWK